MMWWISCIILSFVTLEGLVLLFFPALVKEMLSEADPKALAFAGLVESLLGATLLYLLIVSW